MVAFQKTADCENLELNAKLGLQIEICYARAGPAGQTNSQTAWTLWALGDFQQTHRLSTGPKPRLDITCAHHSEVRHALERTRFHRLVGCLTQTIKRKEIKLSLGHPTTCITIFSIFLAIYSWNSHAVTMTVLSSSCPLSPFIARLATSFNAASFSAPARLVLGLRTLRFATNITTDHLLARSAANPLVFLSVWMSARKCAMDSTSRAVAAPGLLYLHWG